MTKKVARNKYKKNFLHSVTFKMGFPKIFELEEGKPTNFQKKIINEFPLVKEIEGKKFEFSPKKEEKKKDLSIKQEEKIGWRFTNKEKTKVLFIESEFFELKFKKCYKNFEEFFKILKHVFDEFVNLYPIKITKSISLNYINIIELNEQNPYDWSKYINNSLFNIPIDFFKTDAKPLGYINIMEFLTDECKINLTYGLYNSEYPNPITRKEFVLDYECFIEEDIDICDVLDNVKKFHEIEDKWFEMSILDGLREKMEVEKK